MIHNATWGNICCCFTTCASKLNRKCTVGCEVYLTILHCKSLWKFKVILWDGRKLQDVTLFLTIESIARVVTCTLLSSFRIKGRRSTGDQRVLLPLFPHVSRRHELADWLNKLCKIKEIMKPEMKKCFFHLLKKKGKHCLKIKFIDLKTYRLMHKSIIRQTAGPVRNLARAYTNV